MALGPAPHRPTAASVTPTPGWQRALTALDRGTILVVGAPGAGTTALARWLVGQLDRGLDRVALIDCDPGQPAIGVPGCLGLAITGPWEAPAALWFLGTTSIGQRPLPAIVGAAQLAGRARAAGAQAVILDASGLLADAAGCSLAYHLALAVGVDQVLAIGGRGEDETSAELSVAETLRRKTPAAGSPGAELAPLVADPLATVLAALRGGGRRLERVAAASAAQPATAIERCARRHARLAAHFATAVRRWVSPRRIFDPAWQPAAGSEIATGTVVGLLDDDGFCLGLGIVEEAHADRVAILTPVAEVPAVRLQTGGWRIDREGREITASPGNHPTATV